MPITLTELVTTLIRLWDEQHCHQCPVEEWCWTLPNREHMGSNDLPCYYVGQIVKEAEVEL